MTTDEKIYKDFGKRLKYYRKLNHLTQVELADKLDITQSQVYRHEKGLQTIAMSMIQKYANFFNVSISELIDVQPTTTEPTYIDEIKSYNLSENEINELMNYVRFIITKRN